MKVTKQALCTPAVVSLASIGLLVLGAALTLEPGIPVRAQTADWQLVPSNSVPRMASFHSMQFPNSPPLPFDRFPELDVYWSSETPGRYWVDDRLVDYAALEQQRQMDSALRSLESQYGLASLDGSPPIPGGGGGGYHISYPDGSLWLDIAQLTNGQAPLTIHGTTTEVLYEIQSKLSLTNAGWVSEGAVLGATNQNWTPFVVLAGNRTNSLFMRVQVWTNCDGYFTPPAWYVQYGLNPLSPGIGAQDANADALLNYQEYLWGSDPVHAQAFSVWVSSPSGYSGNP